MCLTSIKLYKQDPALIKKGWKRGKLSYGWINYDTHSMERVVTTPCFGFEIRCGIWVSDDSETILRSDDDGPYESGFHVYAEPPPERFTSYVCFVREILAIGNEWDHGTVYVARQIYIPDPKKIFHRDFLIRLFGKRFLP